MRRLSASRREVLARSRGAVMRGFFKLPLPQRRRPPRTTTVPWTRAQQAAEEAQLAKPRSCAKPPRPHVRQHPLFLVFEQHVCLSLPLFSLPFRLFPPLFPFSSSLCFALRFFPVPLPFLLFFPS